MESFGLSLEDYEDDSIALWTDNWLSFSVFIGMSTQWRTGVGGVTGLDYNALPTVMKLRGIKKNKHKQIFNDIQIMEAEALNILLKK